MAFVHGYAYDIFISYCHSDNTVPLVPPHHDRDDWSWVGCFEDALKDKLVQRLGKVEIWRDRKKIDGNDTFTTKIEKNIKDSALLVCLTSRSGINSVYCAQERRLFRERAENRMSGWSSTITPGFSTCC